jgi:hypothetical protein
VEGIVPVPRGQVQTREIRDNGMATSGTLKSHVEGLVLKIVIFVQTSKQRVKKKRRGLEKIFALMFPGHCVLVLVIKLGSSQGKMFGSKDGKVTGSGLFALGL